MGIKGAIFGDIIGSKYEFTGCPNPKTCKLLDNTHFFTDDTIMACAVKWALDNAVPFDNAYKVFTQYYKYYPKAGWGANFMNWAFHNGAGHRQSLGNGSAMRVGYISDFCNNIDDVFYYADSSATPTHNTEEGRTGAVAVAKIAYTAQFTDSKDKLLEIARKYYGSDVDKTLDEYKHSYRWSEICKDSVPLAFRCFYEAEDFESCIRNVLSIYCDSDTICAIAGNIAESFWPNDKFFDEHKLEDYLDSFLLFVLDEENV